MHLPELGCGSLGMKDYIMKFLRVPIIAEAQNTLHRCEPVYVKDYCPNFHIADCLFNLELGSKR